MAWNVVNVKRDRKLTAAEEIYYDIRKMILSGELLPGDTLPPESLLSKHYGRSKPVIREAIRTLSKAGLVKTHPGIKGATVTVPSVELASEFVSNLFVLSNIPNDDFREFKIAFDPPMMRLAALNRDENDLRKIEEDIQHIEEEMNRDGDYISYINQFYNDVAESTKNKTFILINSLFRKAFFEKAHRSSNHETLNAYKVIFRLIQEQKAEEAYREFLNFCVQK